jgi:hypothetical protein
MGLYGRPRAKTIGKCANSIGVTKVQYASEEAALSTAAYRSSGGAGPLRVYQCKRCRYWHITSKDWTENG